MTQFDKKFPGLVKSFSTNQQIDHLNPGTSNLSTCYRRRVWNVFICGCFTLGLIKPLWSQQVNTNIGVLSWSKRHFSHLVSALGQFVHLLRVARHSSAPLTTSARTQMSTKTLLSVDNYSKITRTGQHAYRLPKVLIARRMSTRAVL